MILTASLPFVAFVVWLLAVPMEGFLLTRLGADNAILFFLVPHVITLAVIGGALPRRMLPPLAAVGGAAAVGSTLLIAQAPAGVPWFLSGAGVGSAFVCVKAGSILKRSPSVAASAAVGLVAANALLFVFMAVPVPHSVKFPAAAALLLVPILARSGVQDEADGESNLAPFLPFVFVFQIVSGLMYGALFQDYAAAAFLPGIELVFYVAAVMAGLVLLHRRREGLLALAIVMAMFAFSLVLIDGPASVNVALFAMQAAAGFLDLYLLALLLAQRDTCRAFGIGLAVTCAGIAAGKTASLLIGDAPIWSWPWRISSSPRRFLCSIWSCGASGPRMRRPSRPWGTWQGWPKRGPAKVGRLLSSCFRRACASVSPTRKNRSSLVSSGE
ncbi:LuxR family transcriptional regulator [Geobacter anodireducens]